MNIAIIYGSTTGNTAAAANAIGKAFDDLGDVSVTPVSDGFGSAADANLVILGTSTWGIGEIQDDWQGKEDFGGLGLAGKKVAVFGTGDQNGFGDTFVDGIGLLAEAAEKAGGNARRGLAHRGLRLRRILGRPWRRLRRPGAGRRQPAGPDRFPYRRMDGSDPSGAVR